MNDAEPKMRSDELRSMAEDMGFHANPIEGVDSPGMVEQSDTIVVRQSQAGGFRARMAVREFLEITRSTPKEKVWEVFTTRGFLSSVRKR